MRVPIAEQWLVMPQAIDCRFSQISGSVEATGRESKNENRFCEYAVTGHLNPMTALARKLQSRGNEVVFIGLPDAEPIVRAANLNFVPFCEKEYPVGSVVKGYAPLAKLHGLHVVEHSARETHPGRCKSALEDLPEKLAATGVQALVIDTVHFFVELVPMRLGMPYVHIWNILHVDRSGSSPACFFTWPYETTPEALARNVDGLKKAGGCLRPFWRLRSLMRKRIDYRSTGTILLQPFLNWP